MKANNRVALVTGGSRGIGRAICVALAKRGVDIAINYNTQRNHADDLAEEIRRLGRNALVVQGDVSSEADVAAMINACIEHFGRLDILVSNAGIWRGGQTSSLSAEDWNLVLSTSLTGAFYVTKHALPHMLAAGWGRIIYVSSAVGLMGWAGDAAYAAAKAGIFGLTRSVAKEVAAKGITVNAVAPGSISTDMTHGLPEKSVERLLGAIPMQRLGLPEEVAEMVGALACGGGYVTGAVLVIDGGISL